MGMNNYLVIDGIVFKSGDQISCRIHGDIIEDAKIYITSDEEKKSRTLFNRRLYMSKC